MAESWRKVSSSLVDVGRCLAEVESDLGHIRATGVVDDKQARRYLESALSASRKLTRSLEAIRFVVENPD